MIKVGVVGGSGRLGVELLRLLVMHPNVRIQAVTSRKFCGQRVHDRFPIFRHHFEAQFVSPDVENLAKCDLVFLATPPRVAMTLAPLLLERKIKVIDFSTDFQPANPRQWAALHGHEHPHPALLEDAMIGLPELHRAQLRRARLVSMPSAHATALQIALLPLLDKALIDPARLTATIIAGSEAAPSFGNREACVAAVSDNIKSIALDEPTRFALVQAVQSMSAEPVDLTLVTQQVPVARGLHVTLFASMRGDASTDMQAVYEQRFAEEPFVDVLPAGDEPETCTVRGANMCRIAVRHQASSPTVVILCVIDNLVKGAAGQAVQTMNLMFGIPEPIGLKHLALMS